MKKPVEVDVIILSYAQDDKLLQMTNNCLSSLISSEDPSEIKFNVLVIESQQDIEPYQYFDTTTIYPEEPFGYHTYMNIGIGLTKSKYVCLANNDLQFYKGWASEILKYMDQDADLVSASPICSMNHPRLGIDLDSGLRYGYRIGHEVSGWCLFMKRSIFKTIGKLDENFRFAAADCDYANTLKVCGLKHALVTSSKVDHLRSQTLITQTMTRQDQLLILGTYYFKKWLHRLGDAAIADLILTWD